MDSAWEPYLSPSINFERFVRREVLLKVSSPVVWGIDEVDRLFAPIELVPKTLRDAGIVRGVEHDDRALSASWLRHGDEARDERRLIDRGRIDDRG